MAEVVYVLRHAAPVKSRQKRYWGRGDPGVDPESLAEVAGLVALFPGEAAPERILSSPLSRCIKTAEELLSGLPGRKLELWPELAEVDFGLFDGLIFAEVEAAYPAEAADWARLGDEFAFPGGESIAGFLERAHAAWERTAALPERTLLVVSHGGVLSAWDCFFRGVALAERFSFKAEYAALSAYEREGEGWRRRCHNRKALPMGKNSLRVSPTIPK